MANQLSRFEQLQLRGYQTGSYWISATTADGRKFRYKLGDFLKQISAESLEPDLLNLADQAIDEKYKYCQWDREHPSVDADGVIRETVLGVFRDYVRLIKASAAVEEATSTECRK